MLDRILEKTWGWKSFLISPSSDSSKARKKIGNEASIMKGSCGLSAFACSFLSATCLIASRRYPLCGATFSVTTAAGALISREGYIFNKNVNELMEGSFETRMRASRNNQQFVSALTKDTFVIGPLYGTMIKKLLDDEVGK